jgi:ABC-type phosphate transport system substrate-binding protein
MKRSRDSRARLRRTCTALAGTVAVLVAAIGAVGTTEPAAAQTGGPPQVVVQPPKDLTDTQTVKVDWSGFPASGRTVVRQCVAGATDPDTQCTGILAVSFTNADGTGQGTYAKLAFGSVISPKQATFPCDPDTLCEIRVDVEGATPVTTPIPASIFSKNFPPCPQGAAPLTGDGASEIGGATEAWIREVCAPPRSLTVDYTARNSPAGRQDFIGRKFDYTVTGSPFTADELDRLRQDGGRDQRFVYVPMTAGSLVFAYNFWVVDHSDDDRYKQVRDLCVSADTVARLYNGTQQSLHLEGGAPTLIERDNDGSDPSEPNITFPTAFVHPVGRADASNATLELTSWIYSDKEATAAWEDGGPAFKTEATEIIPASTGTDNRTGARAVARQVSEATGFQRAALGVPTDFVFGIMDLSTARQLGLPVAKVRTKRSDPCVAPTDTNVAAGVGAMTTNADGFTRSPDFSIHSGSVYPLPNVNYALASTDGVPSDPSKNDTLRGFLDYTLGDGQVAAAERGYVPLPADMVAQGRDALARLPGSPGSAPAAAPDDSTNAGLGNFDAGSGESAQSPSASPLTPGGSPSVGNAAGGGTGAADYKGNNPDTSGSALTRFLGADKAIPAILIILLTLFAIFVGPIMRMIARRRTGG